MSRGKLIVLEGLDGAGTTSQAKRLCEALSARGISNHLTRQPSDGPVGKLLRQMLTGNHMMPDGSKPHQDMFGLLFAADRMDHIQREVEPALAAGAVVVSDRWYHSSFAYQGTDADAAWIQVLNQRARVPDLTLFLRVAPEVAAHRRMLAGRVQELFEDLPMQQRVAAGYDRVNAALAARERIDVLDGEQSIDAVWQGIWARTAELLQLPA
ncbi:MAG TPA: dTMP kinase [Kofleriaceae bacterium]|nr:dTMP kinase [Kofleriaceae bacterium]